MAETASIGVGVDASVAFAVGIGEGDDSTAQPAVRIVKSRHNNKNRELYSRKPSKPFSSTSAFRVLPLKDMSKHLNDPGLFQQGPGLTKRCQNPRPGNPGATGGIT